MESRHATISDMHARAPRGFIGILSLLITVAIIGFVVWRSDLFASPSPSGTATTTPVIQQQLDSVKAAEQAKQKVELQYKMQTQENLNQ